MANDLDLDTASIRPKLISSIYIYNCDTVHHLAQVYMKHTRPSAGVGALKGGADFYKACLNWYLSIDKTPEEIHQLGLDEIKRVEEKMHEVSSLRRMYQVLSIHRRV